MFKVRFSSCRAPSPPHVCTADRLHLQNLAGSISEARGCPAPAAAPASPWGARGPTPAPGGGRKLAGDTEPAGHGRDPSSIHRNQSSVVSAEPQRPRRPLGQWFVSVLGNNPQATAPERWAGLETSSRHSQRPACCQRRLGASPPTGQRRGSPWALQDQRPRLGRPNPTWPPPRHQSGFKPRGHGRRPHLPAWPSSREGQRRASPPRRCRHRTARRTETLHQQEAPAPRRATSAHHGDSEEPGRHRPPLTALFRLKHPKELSGGPRPQRSARTCKRPGSFERRLRAQGGSRDADGGGEAQLHTRAHPDPLGDQRDPPQAEARLGLQTARTRAQQLCAFLPKRLVNAPVTGKDANDGNVPQAP